MYQTKIYSYKKISVQQSQNASWRSRQLKVLLASKIQIKKQTNKLQSPQRDLLVGWLSGDAELLWCGV